MAKIQVAKRNDINHIVRNGLIDLQFKTRVIVRQAEDILRRCKEMEGALNKVEKGRNIVIDEPTGNKDPFSQLDGSDIDG